VLMDVKSGSSERLSTVLHSPPTSVALCRGP
jgi:hypothetical protein